MIPACKRVCVVRLPWRVSPARPTRSFIFYRAGTAPLWTGCTWDDETHARWSVLNRDQFLGARSPAGRARLTQSPHTRSPAVGRQVGLGGRRGRVSSVCAIAPVWWDVCAARALRLPSRPPLPSTHRAHPSPPL